MATTAGHFNRHNAYRWLSRVLFPQRYVSKMLLLTFVAAHIPLLVLFVYTVFLSEFDLGITVDLLLVGLIATLAGTAIAMAGIWILLTPIASSSQALERYRSTGVRMPLPLDIRDEGGRLLANVHGTLEGLDTTIVQLEALATRDELTGVYNRREGTRRLLGHLDPRHGDEAGITMILLDADNLKSINDRWGHTTGDHVLQRLAEVISLRVKDHGWVARWGGDEFVAVIRESGDEGLTERLIEGMLEDLESTPLPVHGGAEIQLRLSTGVARHTPGDDMQG
ncbi:MAG: GGDEF domain-containing protein, partial [Chloroflexota bacterium]|nr:GGDEF domain-containing protein [Chloroflexota bacterium]